MKTMEAIGEAPESTQMSPIDQSAMNPVTTSIGELDLGRRRWVRGAAAVAPLVLTLRSGALAAASCTGARIVQIPANGKFPAVATDYCAPNANICPDHPTIPGATKIVTEPQLTVPVSRVPGQDGIYRCPNPATNGFYTGNVAILSSDAHSSLVASG